MLRLRKAVFALLIFCLVFPNLTEAFSIKPILTGVDLPSIEANELIDGKNIEIDDGINLQNDFVDKLEKIDFLSSDDIIQQSKDNPQSYLAGSWDQDYLLDEKAESTVDISNNLTMDLFRGAAQYNYPLDLPAGRNGMAPQLTLFYNHQLENYNDYMPFSWTLGGLMYIERNASNGVDSVYQENEFVFSNGGRLEAYALTDQIHGEYHLKLDEGQALRFFINWITAGNLLIKMVFTIIWGQKRNLVIMPAP